jgi:hypothetical protein
MEKRAFERLPVNFQARLFYGNMIYTGTVTNLSENGMFISTKMNFPVDSVLVSAILEDQSIIHSSIRLPVRIRRTVRSNNYYDLIKDSGIGVELLKPLQEYAEFVSNFKS